MTAIAGQVLQLFKRVAPTNIAVSLTATSEKLGRVGIDGATLERALLNLLVNARDAMPSGGTLQVAISQRVIPAEEAASFNFNAGLTPGRHVVIEVADSGSGMDAATARKAVQPYFTTKAAGKGSGLGLASVNGVCQQCGGGLRIDSQPGAGTRIVLALPVEEPAQRRGVPPRGDARPVDILLVANAPRQHREFLGYLDSQGREVRQVATEQEALEFLDISRPPAVVLIDEGQFGGIDGEQIRADIERRFPDLPVIYVGDYGDGGFDRLGERQARGRKLACA